MSSVFPNGLGESLGAALLVNSPLFVSGTIHHVDSTNAAASDGAGYGVSKNKPYATLAYAIAQASSGDTIVCHDGHTETFTSAQAVTGMIIAGAGQTGGKPTVKLTMNAAAAALFTTGDGSVLWNLWIEEQSQANSVSAVNHTAGQLLLLDCYFEADENSNDYCVTLAASTEVFVKNCTFVSNATDVTDLPTGAITVGASTLLYSEGVAIDANSKGWGTAAITTAAATTRWNGLTLTGNNKVSVTETSANYFFLLTSNSEAPYIAEV